jgi:hypothetical protein
MVMAIVTLLLGESLAASSQDKLTEIVHRRRHKAENMLQG